MWKWITGNRLIVVVSAVLFLIALASAADSYRTRKLLRAAQTNLEETQKAKEKELEAERVVWGGRLLEADRKLAPVLKERDGLRVKLARLEAQAAVPFSPPTSDSDREARWTALGYKVRVLR